MPPLRRVTDPHEPVGGNRIGLALQLEWRDRLDLDRVPHEREGRLTEQHCSRRRSLLQASGDVDRVTGREPLLRPRHHLARHHSDPPLQPQRRERVPHLDRCPHRPQCVVLVHDRHAEDGHHGVADELLDGATVMRDDRLHPIEVAREQRAQPLGIERLAERGRAGEVAEQDGDGLALLVRKLARRFGAALRAEPERSFRLEAATRTCGHVASLGVSEEHDDVVHPLPRRRHDLGGAGGRRQVAGRVDSIGQRVPQPIIRQHVGNVRFGRSAAPSAGSGRRARAGP